MNKAILQIYVDSAWHDAAKFQVHAPAIGLAGACTLAYTLDHFVDYSAAPFPPAALSCGFPVNFDYRELDKWPAFLLDILPSGAGRAHWLKQLQLGDGPASDWQLLLYGTGNPPGNLRIAGAVDRREHIVPNAGCELVSNRNHPGFTREEILEHQENFIEYAAQNGAHVAGCSDVQGVAPKFLLQQDRAGRWHSEGALSDKDVRAFWLVKFPRGKTDNDRKVLRNEAAYMAVAEAIGLKTHSLKTTRENNVLFVPRFDRVVTHTGIERFGMESLYSLAGATGYGVAISQNRFANAIAQFATNPRSTLLEFVRRDIFNLSVGNKDNHGRNTAVFRLPDGTVALTPLFDVAPMYLDPEGIARVCRWEGEAESGGQPIWAKVAEVIPVADQLAFRGDMAMWSTVIERLPDQMRTCGVDGDIIEFRAKGIAEQARLLRDAKPRIVISPNTGGLEP